MLHEVVGHPPGVVEYGPLADDIFADKRLRAQSEPLCRLDLQTNLARASAGTANVINQREFLTTAADIDSHDREAQLHRPFYFQQQLEQQCRSDLSKVDALLLKATLDPKEEVGLEAAVQRSVRFTNTVEYRQSQLRAFARWGLGKWRRRQSQLEEALAAFGAVEDVTFDILGDQAPADSCWISEEPQVDFFYQQNRGKDGWVEGSLEHLQLGQKMLWASVDLAEKVNDHETAAKACIALARVFVTYDDATALNAARSALARAEDHATAITAADRLLADRPWRTISDLKRRVAARS